MLRRPRTRRARRRLVWQLVLALVAAVALLLSLLVAVVAYAPLPRYDEIAAVEPTVSPSAAAVSRGRALVSMTCMGCHGGPADPRLVGRVLHELSPRLGTVVAPNLTRHAGSGVGAWSDATLLRLLRCGVGEDDRFVPPYMPRYTRVADDDLAAVLAFLRSDDPWVAAVAADPGRSDPSLRVKLHALFDWRPAAMPAAPVTAPSRDDPVALGRYLVEDLLQCNLCHGSEPDAFALEQPIDDPGYLGGGIELRDANGKAVFGANITFDVDTGIGAWSFDEFRRAMIDGFRPDGTLLRWPMRRFAALDDVELAAIYAYLASAPHVVKTVPEPAAYRVPGDKLDRGRHLFHKHGCTWCHGEKAPHGGLAAAAAGYADDAALVEFLRDPSRTRPLTPMPGFAGVIADPDLAAVAAYVRSLAGARTGASADGPG